MLPKICSGLAATFPPVPFGWSRFLHPPPPLIVKPPNLFCLVSPLPRFFLICPLPIVFSFPRIPSTFSRSTLPPLPPPFGPPGAGSPHLKTGTPSFLAYSTPHTLFTLVLSYFLTFFRDNRVTRMCLEFSLPLAPRYFLAIFFLIWRPFKPCAPGGEGREGGL